MAIPTDIKERTASDLREAANDFVSEMAKLGLVRFSEKAVAEDLPHAHGVVTVGDETDVSCSLTAAVR